MKLGSFEIGGKKRLGASEDDWVVDLNATYRSLLADRGSPDPEARADFELPGDLIHFIGRNEAALSAVEEALHYARDKDYRAPDSLHSLSQITFRASHRPPKIIYTGTNCED